MCAAERNRIRLNWSKAPAAGLPMANVGGDKAKPKPCAANCAGKPGGLKDDVALAEAANRMLLLSQLKKVFLPSSVLLT